MPEIRQASMQSIIANSEKMQNSKAVSQEIEEYKEQVKALH